MKTPDGLTLRTASADDAAPLSALSGELGYPCSQAVMAERLSVELAQASHLVLAAEAAGQVVGWINARIASSLESGSRAEIVGLVVAPQARGKGIGRALVAAAERWALEKGMTSVVVRSNVAREESHGFYAALGYARRKTQHFYARSL